MNTKVDVDSYVRKEKAGQAREQERGIWHLQMDMLIFSDYKIFLSQTLVAIVQNKTCNLQSAIIKRNREKTYIHALTGPFPV